MIKAIRSAKKCAVPGCTEEGTRRSWCAMHYARFAKCGQLGPAMKLVGRSLADRLERGSELVAKGGCRLWVGYLDKDGYGVIQVDGMPVRAHRAAFQLANGPIPDDAMVLHRCDVRRCISENHLFLGDAGINARDCSAKGRISRGSGRWCAKLTEDAVRDFRERKVRYQEVMEAFAVSRSAAVNALSGKTWRHVSA